MLSAFYARLTRWLDQQIPFYAEPPFEVYAECVPADLLQPPGELVRPTPWLVVLPGKYRPYILADKETEAAAITALEEIAAHFAEAGWALEWQSEQRCTICKPCPEGVLTSRLQVLPGSQLGR